VLLRSIDLAELGRQLGATDWWWVLPPAAVAPLGLWARAIRWRYLFPPRSDPPGLVAANMIGYMANNVLPLRAGELVRVYVVARRLSLERRASLTAGLWLVGATIVVERILDSLALVVILAVLVLLIPVPPALQYVAAGVLALDALAAGALVAVALAPAASRRLLARLTRRWPPLAERAARGLDMVLRGVEGVRTAAHLAPIMGWTILIWIVAAGGAWALLRAVHLDLPFVAGWTVLTFVGFGISIPSAPGYVGVWHAANVLALAIFGVDRTQAFGYAVLYHASQFITITVVGWLFLLREQLSLGEATRTAQIEDPVT